MIAIRRLLRLLLLFMFELGFSWSHVVSISVRYDREGSSRPHWLLCSLNLTPLKDYHLRLMYGAEDPHVLDGEDQSNRW